MSKKKSKQAETLDLVEFEPKRGPGRPPAEIDLAKLEFLASVGCSDKEIAAYLGICPRTLTTKKKQEEIADTIERGQLKGNVSLRHKQMTMALDGDRTMLIWLGKQRLGQKDRVEHIESDESAPTEIHVELVSPTGKKNSSGTDTE